jgi:hypothetical protein
MTFVLVIAGLFAFLAVASWASGGGLEPKNPPKREREIPKGVNPINPMLTRDYGPDYGPKRKI